MINYILTPDEQSMYEKVGNLTMRIARPLIWNDDLEAWPKILHGGTCFILRFDTGLIGVTAEHVIGAFEDLKRIRNDITCLIRTVPINLIESIVDCNTELDIATFKVTERQLKESKAIALDYRPPCLGFPIPKIGAAISFGGYPEALKKMSFDMNIEFRTYVNMAHVEDITDRDIIATYNPTRDIRMRAASQLPNLGANLSGCSGGPVLVHFEADGNHRWSPIGMMIAGPKHVAKGALQDLDIIRLRRIHSV